ncbi:MAG: helix-turn-helix domain-containing protein [Vicinamibacterales bacterium]
MDIRALRAWIEAHLGTLPRADTLARSIGMSREHLSRLFRRTTGETLSAFVTRLRMARAAALIRQGEKVESACTLAGFKSKSSLYRRRRSAPDGRSVGDQSPSASCRSPEASGHASFEADR